MKAQIVESFFKSYDVRGNTIGEDGLNAEIYYWCGFGLVECILKPQNLKLLVNVFRDARTTSEEFYDSFCRGVSDGGGICEGYGLGSTDMMYAACQLNDCSGAMVTASHNPKDDNGLKMLKKAPQMLGLGSGLELIRDFTLSKIADK